MLDGAVVSWPAEAKRPKTSQLADMTGRGALGGAFWGFLFGLLFFVPLLGLAIGAAAGALGGSMANVGIDKDFIEQVKAKVTPGTSALFVLSADEVGDRVLPTFERAGAELIKTNLSAEQEAQLREAFAEDEGAGQGRAGGDQGSGCRAGCSAGAPAARTAPATPGAKPGPQARTEAGPAAFAGARGRCGRRPGRRWRHGCRVRCRRPKGAGSGSSPKS